MIPAAARGLGPENACLEWSLGCIARYWRDGSAVESMGGFSRGPGFSSHRKIHNHLKLQFQGLSHPFLISTDSCTPVDYTDTRAALAEDPASVPRTHRVAPNHP